MSTANMTNFASWMKTQFPNGYQDMLYKNFPLLGKVQKDTGFEGDYKMLVNRFGSVTGASVKFGTAQRNKSPSQVSRFQLARTKEYVVLSVDGETLKASASQKGAVSAILKSEIESGMLTFKRRLANAMYGNGGGSLGQINAISTNTVTLVNRTDAINFSKGMSCDMSSDDGTGGAGVRTKSSTLVVSKVNRRTGVITFTSNVTTAIPTPGTSDYLFWEDDYAGKINGLRAWCPDSDPSATTFLGVDRTQDTTKLGGVRVPAGATIEETLQDAVAELYIEGAEPEWCMLNPLDWNRLAKSLGSKAVIDVPSVDNPRVGFKGLQLATQSGTIDVLGDPFCPKGRSFMSQSDVLELSSLGECPGVLMDDGNKMLRDLTEDAYEVRIGAYLALGCEAPGWVANIALP